MSTPAVRFAGINPREFVAFVTDGPREVRVRWRRAARNPCDACGPGNCHHVEAALTQLRKDFQCRN